jgi:hypothetical protein
MKYKLRFTFTANEQMDHLENDQALGSVFKQVRKTLGYLETNIRSKSLKTHEFVSLSRRYGKKVFEAYVQHNTPSAYRIFWHYGPDETDNNGIRIAIITILAITPHP